MQAIVHGTLYSDLLNGKLSQIQLQELHTALNNTGSKHETLIQVMDSLNSLSLVADNSSSVVINNPTASIYAGTSSWITQSLANQQSYNQQTNMGNLVQAQALGNAITYTANEQTLSSMVSSSTLSSILNDVINETGTNHWFGNSYSGNGASTNLQAFFSIFCVPHNIQKDHSTTI
ncbi:hypothetical protein [Helicobacter heilmannii]|uniref:hypothetical protein n=1 Tax=Helicobacter heilmannii TaxID=35817 RepID=UPI001315A6F7|nr:hypothetical protein [Helicobacter heilmannii]GMB94988.1 hypothetical protein NHP21011_10830 [Helicobacter heilmannii]